jgi:hypothetical protein
MFLFVAADPTDTKIGALFGTGAEKLRELPGLN